MLLIGGKVFEVLIGPKRWIANIKLNLMVT